MCGYAPVNHHTGGGGILEQQVNSSRGLFVMKATFDCVKKNVGLGRVEYLHSNAYVIKTTKVSKRHFPHKKAPARVYLLFENTSPSCIQFYPKLIHTKYFVKLIEDPRTLICHIA